jgi:hypothetical protein
MNQTIDTPIPTLSPIQVITGLPIHPINRVRIMTDKEFEKLTEAWVGTLKTQYVRVAHFGSAGDKGIDVAGFCDALGFKGVWDSFQCKHRDHPLRPTDVYADIGKLLWHISNGEYACPRSYRFVGSRDLGTKLNQFLHDPATLKTEVEKNWATSIETSITETTTVTLTGKVKATFDSFDFSIFGHQKLQVILDGLRGTAYYTSTFGGGLPPRPQPAGAPPAVQPREMVYVEKLRKAYSAHSGNPIPDVASIVGSRPFGKHFERQRRAFYFAEGLREFSKETVPPGTFEALQNDILCGVQPVIDAEHKTPYVRLSETVKQAVTLPLTSNALVTATTSLDRHGVCHQLSNDDKLSWDNDD